MSEQTTDQEAKWYAIQTYAGHENKVKTLIERRIEEEPGEGEDKEIQEVMVPTHEVVEDNPSVRSAAGQSPFRERFKGQDRAFVGHAFLS